MKKNILKLILISFLTAAAVFLAVFILIKKIDFNLNALQIVFICLIAVFGIFINIFFHMFFHEIGHLIFGKINGFKLYALSVWFFSIEKRAGKKGFKFKLNSSKYGGVSQMLPTSEKKLYKKFGFYILGGLAGSFFITAGFLLILLLVNLNTIAVTYIYAALVTGFPLSIYFLFLNAIPFSSGGFSNDGGMIRGLLKKNSETKIYINVLIIQSKLYAGLTPAEIDEKLYFDVPVVADNCMSKILLINLKYNYFLDKLDFESSNNMMMWLERIEKYLPDVYLEQILLDKFFNMVFYLKDFANGEEIYSKVMKFLESNDICSLRIKMVYELFILKDKELAIKTGKRALELKDSYPIKGIARMEEKIIKHIIHMLNGI